MFSLQRLLGYDNLYADCSTNPWKVAGAENYLIRYVVFMTYSSILRMAMRIFLVAVIVISTFVTSIVGSYLRARTDQNEENTVHAQSSVNVWWPVPNVKVGGVQPFKAMISGQDVNSYDMYWQVDGDRLNSMHTSYTDYPHKEAMVDLSGWNWRGAGPYTIAFIAKDRANNTIAQSSFVIYTSSPTPKKSYVLTSLWPVDGSRIVGSQLFKAVIEDKSIEEYHIYWQVDGDRLNPMENSYTGFPHKETVIELSGWTWRGEGPYRITFVAKDNSQNELARKDMAIYVPRSIPTPTPVPVSVSMPVATSIFSPTPTVVPTPIQISIPTPSLASVSSQPSSVSENLSLPIAQAQSSSAFYVDPNSSAKKQADMWRWTRPDDARLMNLIASQPVAKWVGDWNSDIRKEAQEYTNKATETNTIPIFAVYNVPGRDCSNYSAGGAQTAEKYKNWINAFASGIGDQKATVILEPDALALMDCLSSQAKQVRFDLIAYAVSKLKANGKTKVYVDAGHAKWIASTEMAERLQKAGIQQADGFALNVSNFYSNEENVRYGEEVSRNTGGKHFVIDSSRNGVGALADLAWCNPQGRALGTRPTVNTGHSLLDAYLWVKVPGESDGPCNGGPSAGQWWPEYALDLARKYITRD